MNKTDLVNAIAAGAKLTKVQAKDALEAALQAAGDALAKGDKIALIGFGTLAVSEKAARTGRNPRTKESTHENEPAPHIDLDHPRPRNRRMPRTARRLLVGRV